MGFTVAELLGHQAQVFRDFPTESITISGVTYAGLVMENSNGNNWVSGGNVDDRTLRIAIERSAISSAIPTEGALATYNSTSYRIARVEQDDAAASIILNLTDPTLAS